MAAFALAIILLTLLGCSSQEPIPDGPGDDAGQATLDRASPRPASTLGTGAVQEGPSASPAPVAAATAWTTLTPAPVALSEVTAAGHAGEVWTAGGLTRDGQAVTSVQRYVPRTGQWQAGPDLPTAVHHSALVSTGDRLLLLGGYEGSDFATPTAAVWVLSDEIEGWRSGPPLPEPRAAGAAAHDGRNVVYGGGVGPAGVASEVWRLEGEEWSAAGLLSTPREHLAAAGGDGVVWFMGGRVGGLDTNLGRVDVVAGGAVRTLGDVLPAAGGVSGFATPDGRGCMVGGEDPTATSATVACVDADGTTSGMPDLQVPRHGLGVAVVDDTAYVAMGGPEPGLFVSDVLEALALGR